MSCTCLEIGSNTVTLVTSHTCREGSDTNTRDNFIKLFMAAADTVERTELAEEGHELGSFEMNPDNLQKSSRTGSEEFTLQSTTIQYNLEDFIWLNDMQRSYHSLCKNCKIIILS